MVKSQLLACPKADICREVNEKLCQKYGICSNCPATNGHRQSLAGEHYEA